MTKEHMSQRKEGSFLQGFSSLPASSGLDAILLLNHKEMLHKEFDPQVYI
jgi:hypothetical protein